MTDRGGNATRIRIYCTPRKNGTSLTEVFFLGLVLYVRATPIFLHIGHRSTNDRLITDLARYAKECVRATVPVRLCIVCIKQGCSALLLFSAVFRLIYGSIPADGRNGPPRRLISTIHPKLTTKGISRLQIG